MSMRANVFALPVGTVLTGAGDSTNLVGLNLSGVPYGAGIDVGPYDELALDFTVTSVTGGNIIFWFDRQGADGLWYPIANSQTFTAAGTFSTTLAGQNSASQSFGLVGRVRWTMTGTVAVVSASIVGK